MQVLVPGSSFTQLLLYRYRHCACVLTKVSLKVLLCPTNLSFLAYWQMTSKNKISIPTFFSLVATVSLYCNNFTKKINQNRAQPVLWIQIPVFDPDQKILNHKNSLFEFISTFSFSENCILFQSCPIVSIPNKKDAETSISDLYSIESGSSQNSQSRSGQKTLNPDPEDLGSGS